MPTFEEIDLLYFYFLVISAIAANAFLFKKLFLNIYDPIWFFVIINTSVTIALVFYSQDLSNYVGYTTALYVVLCQLLFVTAALYTRKAVKGSFYSSLVNSGHQDYRSRRIAKGLLALSSVILFALCVYYWRVGLPSLNEDPELARVMARRDGGGATVRVLNVFSYLSLTLWFYCLAVDIRMSRVFRLVSFALPLFLILFVGAKAALLNIYISYFYVNFIVNRDLGKKFEINKKYFVALLVATLLLAFTLLYARAETVGADVSNAEFAVIQLLSRIVFSGVGAYHFFSTPIQDLADFGPLDYVYQYLMVPLLAPLRVVPYVPTLGSILAISMTGDDTFGPNPSMFVEGIVYYGIIFGVVYCGVLGAIFAVFKFGFSRTKVPAVVRVIVFSFSNMLVMTITYDSTLFISDLINSIVLLLPILIAAIFMHSTLPSTSTGNSR